MTRGLFFVDEPSFVLRLELKREGCCCDVHVAHQGGEARERSGRNGCEGEERPDLKGAKLVMLNVKVQPPVPGKGLEVGANLCATKSFGAAELLENPGSVLSP